MKRTLALILAFIIVIGNVTVFAEGEQPTEEQPIEEQPIEEQLGSLVVTHIDKDTLEILETETLVDLEMGEHIVNSKLISGYELADTVTKSIYLEIENKTQEVSFNYTKEVTEESYEKEYDGLAHLKLIDSETNEIILSEDLQLVEGEKTIFSVPVFIENAMLEISDYNFDYQSNRFDSQSVSSEKAKMVVNFDYRMFDENYISDLVVEIPNGVQDFTADLEIEYRKVKPFVRVQSWLEGEMLFQKICYVDSLGIHTIQAEKMEGFIVEGEDIKEITLNYINHNTEIVRFDYTLDLSLEEPREETPVEPSEPREETPVEPSRPIPVTDKPIEPSKPIVSVPTEEPLIEEKIPVAENIPEGVFISRWEGHKIINEPIKFNTKQIIKMDFSKELLEEGLQPRLYKYNEEKEKWVALATKINGNIVESYEEVDGYVAVFLVKQPTFSDVKGNEFYAKIVDRANGLGIVEGILDEKGNIILDAETVITRKEFYAMVGRIFGAVPKGQTSIYDALDNIVEGQGSEWYTPYINEFRNKGIFVDEEVNKGITWKEALELLSQMINIVDEVDSNKTTEIQIIHVLGNFNGDSLGLDSNLSRIEAITMLLNILENLGW